MLFLQNYYAKIYAKKMSMQMDNKIGTQNKTKQNKTKQNKTKQRIAI